MGFKEYKKLFDISSLQMMNTSDTVFKNDYKMLSIRLLDRTIDSIRKQKDSLGTKLNREVNNQLHYVNLRDDIWKRAPAVKVDTSFVLATLPDSVKIKVYEGALTIAYSLKNSYQIVGNDMDSKRDGIKVGLIEWHRKFSLSLACLVLFFIGAPLGSIIRKGGLGMPLVVAILFFLIFHLLNMFGEKFVKENMTTPLVGMWLAVLVLTPLGMFLTYKAMHDSALFNKEFYFRIFKNIRLFFNPVINKLNRKQ